MGELVIVSENDRKEKQLYGDMFGFIGKISVEATDSLYSAFRIHKKDIMNAGISSFTEKAEKTTDSAFNLNMLKPQRSKSDQDLLPKPDNDFLLVLTCWDGTTYLLTPDLLNVYRFNPEPIACRTQAFVAGKYSMQPGCHSNVLVYATFSDTLLLYYNLELSGEKDKWKDVKESKLKSANSSGIDVSKHAKNLARMNSNQISMLLAADVDLLTKYRDLLKSKLSSKDSPMKIE